MRLSELRPRWLEVAGERVAIMFQCPHCVIAGKSPEWLTCFFKPIADLPLIADDHPVEAFRGSSIVRLLFCEALRDEGHPDPVNGAYSDVVSCKKSIAWQRVGNDFDSMSITPSIDASAAGHWHGFIQAGNIT